MPPRSTANFLSYDVRPAKQAERRILLDVLKTAGDCGLPIPEYQYIGMGANRFYDFLLVHKYLGIKSMISLEHDPVMYKRALFNVPYSFIDVLDKTAAEFLAGSELESPLVIWFDYDGGIGPRMLRDIAALSTKLKIGDFAFVTSYGGPPRVLAGENSEARLAWLQDNMRDVAGEVTREHCEEASFAKAVHIMLVSAFKNAFAVRKDGVFVTAIQIEYSDTTPMITVGGGLLTHGQAHDFKRKMSRTIPFLKTEPGQLYSIQSMHLTERERVLFDLATTKAKRRSRERNQLAELGFKDKDLTSYQDLLRYLPRYVETIV